MNEFGRPAQHPAFDQRGRARVEAAPAYRPQPGSHVPGGPWQPVSGPPPRPPVPGQRGPGPQDRVLQGGHGRGPQGPWGPGHGQSQGPQWPAPDGWGRRGPATEPLGPPQGAGPAGAGRTGAAAPAPRKRRGRWIAALVLLGGLAGGAVWYVGRSAPTAAAVGACVTQAGTDDISIVGCGEPAAQFRVVGRLENRTMIDAGLFACSEFPQATSSFWQGPAGAGELGLVLCLAPVTT
jgi:hypothetical protein